MGVRKQAQVRRAELGLAALAGIRLGLPPSLLAEELSRNRRRSRRQPAKWLSRAWPLKGSVAFALSELIADKLPFAPDRIGAIWLLGRAASGALVAATVASIYRRPEKEAALLGAVVAVSSAFGTFYLRRLVTRRWRVPNAIAGVLEDRLAISAGKQLIAAVL